MSIARHHADWLSLVEISGPFLSMPVLLRAFPQGLDAHDPEVTRNLRLAYEEWADNQQGLRPDPAINAAWVRFVLRDVLGFTSDLLITGPAIPEGLKATVAEQGETLRPDLMVQRAGFPPRILVQIVQPGQDLDKPLKEHRWKASPATRLAELLRVTSVRLGLVTNGERWMLVHAPAGETAGFISWYAALWLDEPVTLRAFRSLLGIYRVFGVPDADTLEALLIESAANQQEVTDQLGYQVRQAVEVLVQTLDRIDKDRGRTLLASVSETMLYEAALTVMMRLVFLFSAEERGLLLLGKPMYDEHYAVSTLRAQLRTTADETGEEVLERRHDAWSRLLATFRAVFGGVQHEDLRLPAYGGALFDPDRFPFLEGRAQATRWTETPARPVPVDNRTVLHLLEALQILRISVPGGGPAEPRRLSFRALDIEQIGHVYEGLLDHTAKRTADPVLGLAGTKDREPEISLVELERRAYGAKPKGVASTTLDMFGNGTPDAALRDNKALLEFLREETGRSTSALTNGLSKSLEWHDLDALRAACDNDAALVERVKPFAGLLRLDTFGRPVIITSGSVYVTAGTDRRSSGTHYTPRSLTESIIQHALDPLVYDGPADGKTKAKWRLYPAESILSVRVCDMAMGSGAFLVQSCRYLAERLAEAAENRTLGSSLDNALNDLFTLRDPEDRLAQTRRLVADRCLYGVDKNSLAVEMAKLSLWLVTLQKDRPFSFLDHALRSGDSLLGIANIDQLLHWSLARDRGSTTATFLTEPLRRTLQRATALRRKIRETQVLDVRDAQQKAEWLRKADTELELVRLAADLLVAAQLHSNAKQREKISLSFQYRISLLADVVEETRSLLADAPQIQASSEERQALRAEADALLQGHRPFHWPLELPEIFIEDTSDREQMSLATDKLGFTAIVGNPPFQGGQKITGALGIPYRDYLVEYLAHGRRGSADLCAYFFLRAGQAVQEYGQMGLLATNTIAQGDTREVGLDQLTQNDYAISRAIPSLPWPGLAALEVAHVWVSRGEWIGSYNLNNQWVSGITPLLSEPGTTHGPPHRLAANQGKSYQGSIVLGMGFVLAPEEAQTLIATDSRNREVLFPYLNGEDLNSRPDQSPSRWVINFQDWPLDKAETYPDCLQIVREKVKPGRDKVNRKARQERWWQFAERSPNLYKAVAGTQQVLVACRVTKFLSHTLVPANYVYDVTTNIFAEDVTSLSALLNSAIFDVWVRQNASSLETRVRYTLTDCFETFPFPKMLAGLDTIGEAKHEHRRQLTLERQEGLTKIYNRFHDTTETSADIAELRQLHVAMDQAVAVAYGWADLDLGHGFHETKQGLRYTISEVARRTVLDRLLTLNHQRYAEEVALGLHDKGAKKTKERAKKVVGTMPSYLETPQLVMDLGISGSAAQSQEDVVGDFDKAVRQRPTKKVAEEQTAYNSATSVPTNEPDRLSQPSELDRHVILIARIIQRHRQHGYEKTLGHVKAEKIVHIIEAHCGAELGRLPVREAAGPADFQRLLAVAARGKHLNAFQDNRRPSEHKAYQFVPLGNLKRTASKIEDVFGDLALKIDQVIDLFVGLKTSEAEVVATLYAAWNDLLADGEAIDEERLFQEFYGWSKSKGNFQLGELRRMKAWMEAVRLVPTGKAKRTMPRGSV